MDAAVTSYLTVQEQLAPTLPAAALPWLATLRDEGVKRLRDVGFPTVRDEDWRYTNVRPILKEPFEIADAEARVDPSFVLAAAIPSLLCHRLVIVDGIIARELSDTDGLPDGIKVNSLSNLVASEPTRVEPYLGKVAVGDTHGFTAMNAAFMADGVVIEIAPGQTLDKPLELLFICSGAGESVMAQPRNLIVVGKDARLQILERYVSAHEQRSLTNVVTELVLDENAQVSLYRLQEESGHSFHVGGLFAKLGPASRLDSLAVTLSGALVRNDLHVELDGNGAEANLRGLYVARGRQHVDNHTQVVHNEPGCISRQHYKGILDDRAHAVFHGRIVVQPDAQQTDSEQSNQNLLLSRDAEIDSKPQLEIYADDVKCSHGATVGQLDTDALFYLKARGIPEDEARRMLIGGFASEVLLTISEEPIKEHLLALVGARPDN